MRRVVEWKLADCESRGDAPSWVQGGKKRAKVEGD